MPEKYKDFNANIVPSLQKIDQYCRLNKIPMLMVFCIDVEEVGDGKKEMDMVGFLNIDLSDISNPIHKAAKVLEMPVVKEDTESFEKRH